MKKVLEIIIFAGIVHYVSVLLVWLPVDLITRREWIELSFHYGGLIILALAVIIYLKEGE